MEVFTYMQKMSLDVQIKNENYSQEYDDDQSNYDEKHLKQEDDEYDDDDDEDDPDYDVNDKEQQLALKGIIVPKYIRLRGLPWSARHQEILDFLKNVNVIDGSNGIHLVTNRWDGKNTGEAYVEVESAKDVEEARKLNKASMGHRYIEVFTASSKEAKEAMRKTSSHGMSYVVKLRGLPYAVTEQQIEEFFNGLEIKPDREGILFVMDRRGRATGEAFVQFESQEDTEQALGRNREKIGHRYIEIFRSSLAELKRAASGNGRPSPYDIRDRGGNRGNDYGRNNMRGSNDWGGNGGSFGIGANNTLGFNNLPGLMNSGNFGNGFGSNNGGGGNFSNNFGNNGGGFGNGNNSNGSFGGNNRFNNSNGNFGNDFGDFNNFGNNRNFNNGNGNDFGGNNMRGNNGNNFGNNNFGNGNNMGGNGFNSNNHGNNFGPIGGGRSESEYFTIHMRGLPYSSFENDVFKFFDPMRPANVRINFNKKGLHSGTADAFFDTYEDAQLAMKRHREQMGSRYIELFFDGKTKSNNNFSRRI